MTKRIFGLLLALCLVAGMLPMAVLADDSAGSTPCTTCTPAADDGDCTTAIKCTVCGKETTPAKTAHAYTNGADTDCNNEGCTKTREPKTTFALSFGTNDAGSDISSSEGYATLKMNAGDATKYYVTKAPTADAYKENSILKATTDTTNWNMKVEYPADGIPTVTLKNAIIDAKYGMLFGGWDAANQGSVKLVLEGENIIAAEYSYKGALQFLFKGDKGEAIIEGPGKLTVSSNCHGGEKSKMGIVNVENGILNIQNKANLLVLGSEEWGCAHGIAVSNGDLNIKDATVKVVGYDDSKTLHYEGQSEGYNLNAHAMYSGIAVWKKANDDAATNGNLNITDGANVTVLTSIPSHNLNNKTIVFVENKFTIKESTVEIAKIGKCVGDGLLFGSLPTLEYANNAYTTYASKTKVADFTPVAYDRDQYTKDGSVTPVEGKWADAYDAETKIKTLTYFKVAPGGTGKAYGVAGGTSSGSTSGGSSSGSSSPNTGDISILMTAGLALASAVSFAGVTVIRKKH